jgi:hypothetical protein
MEDTASVRPLVGEHQRLLGEGTLHSFGADKGYYSGANHKHLREFAKLSGVPVKKRFRRDLHSG